MLNKAFITFAEIEPLNSYNFFKKLCLLVASINILMYNINVREMKDI